MCQRNESMSPNSKSKQTQNPEIIKNPKNRQITYFLRTAINLAEAGALLVVNNKSANFLTVSEIASKV